MSAVRLGGRHGYDPEEHLDFRWLPFDEVMSMITRGEITDALTVLPMQALALDRRRHGRSRS